MKETRYIELFSNPGSVLLEEIPIMGYDDFLSFTNLLMGEEGTHCAAYFVLPQRDKFRFICCMAADENHALVIYSHEQEISPLPSLPSISEKHFQFHVFEREIHEQYGIGFTGHPWLKPIRYPYNRADQSAIMDCYPFYSIEGEELHEVGVGPVHAGIIEPGHFRFICNGEKVLHLEIHLGYQHRGLERLMVEKQDILARTLLAESIAGDTVVGHTMAYSGLMESLSGKTISSRLSVERIIALELERIGIHIGDTAAICTDIAYQFGQVVNEALRTIIINTTQLWCGNRFGKGLIRPGRTHYPLQEPLAKTIMKNLDEVEERYLHMADRIFSLPSVLGRFESIGKLSTMQATLIGAVGMTARTSGMHRDVRWSHPFGAYVNHPYNPVILKKGDVWSRAMLRKMEAVKSIEIIRQLLKELKTNDVHLANPGIADSKYGSENPKYFLAPSSFAVSLVEGWRGEICHIAVTDTDGKIISYKIKDPSFHNWQALALAVRNQEISDFPLCNKSFNLSYCGHDL